MKFSPRLLTLLLPLCSLTFLSSCSDDDDDAPDACAQNPISVDIAIVQLSAFAAASGGEAPYTFEWSNATTGDSLIQVFPGTYELTVTDSRGCAVSREIEIINFCAGSDMEVTLFASLGSAEAEIAGGEPPYQFNWNTGDSTLTIQNLSPGNYTFTVTDHTGCTLIQSVPVGGGCGGTTALTDVDGNTYQSVEIGGQCWMAENLKTTRYQNGDALDVLFQAPQPTEPSGSFLSFPDSLDGPGYGNLYNWYAISDERNVCPSGWRTPTLAEIEVLVNHLGGMTAAGGALKAIDLWDAPNTGATNSSGFTALPAGEADNAGFGEFAYNDQGRVASFWTSSDEPNSSFASHMNLSSDFAVASIFTKNKRQGISIRCIKAD